jgi:hypothetical protein
MRSTTTVAMNSFPLSVKDIYNTAVSKIDEIKEIYCLNMKLNVNIPVWKISGKPIKPKYFSNSAAT